MTMNTERCSVCNKSSEDIISPPLHSAPRKIQAYRLLAQFIDTLCHCEQKSLQLSKHPPFFCPLAVPDWHGALGIAMYPGKPCDIANSLLHPRCSVHHEALYRKVVKIVNLVEHMLAMPEFPLFYRRFGPPRQAALVPLACCKQLHTAKFLLSGKDINDSTLSKTSALQAGH